METDKKEIIDGFLNKLREQSKNDFSMDVQGAIGDILEHFSIHCKKCGSGKIYVSWEEGTDYGDYTGYEAGQKLFKCLECGNAASFWE